VSKPGHSLAMSPGPIRFSREWITRPVFAVLLGGAVVFAIFKGKPYIEIVAAAAALLGAREWHRLVGEGRYAFELIASVAVLWSALGAFILWPNTFAPALILGGGTVLLFAVAFARRNHPMWHAAGVIYLGVPALAIIALHDFAPHGPWVLIGLFLIVWATDTGALFCGNLIGGPKIVPRLSPKKTWSGTIGGIVAASAVESVFILIIGGHVLAGALFGAGMGAVAHVGDLFESWVKRCFRVKDSGAMIPGHGGVLDRIDSTIATLAVLGVLVLVFKLDPLFGGAVP
jgi:phosphatidate cytidylyltransferase